MNVKKKRILTPVTVLVPGLLALVASAYWTPTSLSVAYGSGFFHDETQTDEIGYTHAWYSGTTMLSIAGDTIGYDIDGKPIPSQSSSWNGITNYIWMGGTWDDYYGVVKGVSQVYNSPDNWACSTVIHH